MVLVLGHRSSFPMLADRAASWAHLLTHGIDIPWSDALPDPATAEIVGTLRHRDALLPEDVLAAVFHGLAARRMRGASQPGDDVETFANNLRGLADALIAFNNYRPGEFVDEQVVAEVAEERRQREGRGCHGLGPSAAPAEEERDG
jgi:hypothetical protein